MVELQKILLIVRFFNRISCNKDLKAKFSYFFSCLLFDFLRLECSRIRKTALFLKKYKNLHPRSFTMEWKRGKCWKSLIFESKLRVFISYQSEMKTVSIMYIFFYSSTFYSLFLRFFVLEIFKFKYDKFFARHSASNSKFECFEQPWLHVFTT